MRVEFHIAARAELLELPAAERDALNNAVEKLEALGTRLAFPHQSAVKGSEDLRELRPRAGRSPWRAFYGRIGDTLVVAAIGPEAKVDKRGFNRAVAVALERLSAIRAQQMGDE